MFKLKKCHFLSLFAFSLGGHAPHAIAAYDLALGGGMLQPILSVVTTMLPFVSGCSSKAAQPRPKYSTPTTTEAIEQTTHVLSLLEAAEEKYGQDDDIQDFDASKAEQLLAKSVLTADDVRFIADVNITGAPIVIEHHPIVTKKDFKNGKGSFSVPLPLGTREGNFLATEIRLTNNSTPYTVEFYYAENCHAHNLACDKESAFGMGSERMCLDHWNYQWYLRSPQHDFCKTNPSPFRGSWRNPYVKLNYLDPFFGNFSTAEKELIEQLSKDPKSVGRYLRQGIRGLGHLNALHAFYALKKQAPFLHKMVTAAALLTRELPHVNALSKTGSGFWFLILRRMPGQDRSFDSAEIFFESNVHGHHAPIAVCDKQVVCP